MAKLTPPVNDNDHVRGPYNAPVELVEYGDYQCPYCAAAHPVVKAIEDAYSRNLKFAFRHFPLSQVHQYARAAAIAAEAAGRQEKFWEMHDMIYEHQPQFNERALFNFATMLELDIVKFERDIGNDYILQKVESDFDSGVRSGVSGTPSFFINGVKYNGAYDFESLVGAIQTVMDVRYFR